MAILTDTAVELIYRMYMNGEQNLNEIKNILKEITHSIDKITAAKLIDRIRAVLQEYICTMNKTNGQWNLSGRGNIADTGVSGNEQRRVWQTD